MKRIGLLSDTHGSLPEAWLDFFKDVDEIWHAGDIGTPDVLKQIESRKPWRAVFGNIDSLQLRNMLPEDLVFDCEGMKVLLTHIGGYPGKYEPRAKTIILREKPGLFVCGHSHILKVMFDEKLNLLHINPGAAGRFGLHQSITMVRFSMDAGRVLDLEIYDKPRS